MIPAHWTEHDLSIDGACFHYVRTGDGQKPPLVLAHGFSDDGLCWLQMALDLEENYDIIMPDARGHGRSERVVPGQPVDRAADLAAIIQALDLQRPIIVGHSMGAMTAFQLGVHDPDLPRALVLEDPPWFQFKPGQAAMRPSEHPMTAMVATIQRLSLDELIDQTRKQHPTWSESTIQLWCSAKKRLDPNILSCPPVGGMTWAADLPKLTCPTLVLTADPEMGGLIRPAIAEQAQASNPLCTVINIANAGHHIRLEANEAYMQEVQDFLRGLA